MANIRPKTTSVTTTEDTLLLGTGYRTLHVKNSGGTDVLIGFDAPIAAGSYLLEAGEALTITEHAVIRLHFKTSAGSSTLYVLTI